MVKLDARNSGTDNQNGFRDFLPSSTPKEISAIVAFATPTKARLLRMLRLQHSPDILNCS